MVGMHGNQSTLGPKKCLSQWPMLHVLSLPWQTQAASSGGSVANKDPNRRCIRTSRPLISHVTSWFSFVCVIVFRKNNFPLKISPRNYIYLRKEKQTSICFLYNITPWGSCHENIYIFKISLFFHCLFFFYCSFDKAHFWSQSIQILLGKLIGTISDMQFPIS